MSRNISAVDGLKIGAFVSGRVTNILPSGVLVRLDCGAIGKVRARELFWDKQKVREYRKHVQRDQRLDMVVRELTFKHVHLSVRLRERNPWSMMDRSQLALQSETVEILGRSNRKAYGELDSGVAVEIDLIEIREYLRRNARHPGINYELVVGDRVRGTIRSFDDDREIVILDVPAYLSRMTERFQIESASSSAMPSATSTVMPQRRAAASTLRTPMRILAAGNDPTFNAHLAGWLSDWGYKVERAETLGILRTLCIRPDAQDAPFDLALIDLDFPQPQEVFGAARIIQETFPSCRICFMTAKADLPRGVSEKAADVHFHDILFQPISEGEMERVLAADTAPMSWDEFVRTSQASRPGLVDTSDLATSAEVPPGVPEEMSAEIQHVLVKAICDIGAAQGAVFAMHPESYDCRVVASSGFSRTQFESMRERGILRYSPIRDVTIDREIIRDNQCPKHFGKHRNLFKAVGEYKTCLAVPLVAPGEYSYALFLFNSTEGRFTEDDLRQVRQVSLRLSVPLQTLLFVEERQRAQGFVLAGQLAAAFQHDLNKMLELARITAKRVATRLKEWPISDQTIIEAQQIFRDHEAAIDAASATAKDCLLLVAQEQVEQEFDLHNVIGTSIARTENMSRLHKDFGVNFEYIRSEDVPKLKGYALRLERVFLNLLANALEQSELFIGTSARITVRSEWDREGNQIRVTISDTGPGVSHAHRKRIFEPLFTTKPIGFGLGLPIAQNIVVVDFGGSLQLTETTRLAGSTFEVTLPLNLTDVSKGKTRGERDAE